MVPFEAFPEIPPRENDEHAERDDLLDDLQLKRGEFSIADAIRGDLEAIFGEGDQPAHDDRGHKRGLAVFQVTVPSESHEDV